MSTPFHIRLVVAFAAALGSVAVPQFEQNPALPEIERTPLKTAQVIEDVPCSAGDMWRFVSSGRLHRCTLDRDAVVRGAALPAGTSIAFNPDGSHRYAFLPRTSVIEGYRCRGSGHDYMTAFHPDGKLKLCWLPEDVVIQGIPCAGASFWSDAVLKRRSGVFFHPNGRLRECRLSQEVTRDGAQWHKNERVSLSDDGRLIPSK